MYEESEVAVPKLQRTEVPRSAEDDISRAAVVTALAQKHGLVFKPRRGTLRMAHAATNHGVRSFTFYTTNHAGVRLS